MPMLKALSIPVSELFSLKHFKAKNTGKLELPVITSGNRVEAISFKDAIDRIGILKSKAIGMISNRDDAELWFCLYTLALCAQEKMICSLNDDLISSDIPWDMELNVPLISATAGDAISYAERLSDPKDHLLKALLLSFSGWALLSTEKKECACGKEGLREITIDVLVSTIMTRVNNAVFLELCVGVQSDNQRHLDKHYSFAEQSKRHENLIIIHDSTGRFFNPFRIYSDKISQAEQFRSDKMREMLKELINSFN